MYIDRNEQDEITGAFSRPQREGQERIDRNDPELQAFLNPQPTTKELALEALQQTENPADLARKVEEMLDYIINGTPLPVNQKTGKPYAEEWLNKRKSEAAKIRS